MRKEWTWFWKDSVGLKRERSNDPRTAGAGWVPCWVFAGQYTDVRLALKMGMTRPSVYTENWTNAFFLGMVSAAGVVTNGAPVLTGYMANGGITNDAPVLTEFYNRQRFRLLHERGRSKVLIEAGDTPLFVVRADFPNCLLGLPVTPEQRAADVAMGNNGYNSLLFESEGPVQITNGLATKIVLTASLAAWIANGWWVTT